jgi:endonuclease/exonuclease/phosphatase family metal-dependent hydrolase
MKVISYNIYRHNKQLNNVFNFLQTSNADIICLQEVPKIFLNKLQTDNPNKYYINYSNEYFIKSKKNKHKSILLYNVILSKSKPEKIKEIPHLEHDKFPIYYQWINKYDNLDIKGLYIDITNSKQKYRIFNSHLECVASPNFRINQFKNLYTHKALNRKNIFTGDYNVFASPLLSIFVGIFSGYKPKDYTIIEKNQFKKLFETLNLKNIFHRKRTFKTFPFQTDFIVTDKQIIFDKPTVHKKELNGSDHFPISVEIT